MTRQWNRAVYLLAAVFLGLFAAAASARVTEQQENLVQAVYQRLIAAAPVGPENSAWPPELLPIKDVDEVQARCFNAERDPARPAIPKLEVCRGLMDKIVKGDADRLAYIVAHEITHAARRHIVHTADDPRWDSKLLYITFTREQELEADEGGMAMALRAGYDFQKALGAIQEMIEQKMEFSSFEAMHANHPSWKERLAVTDKDHAKMWTSMATFHSGVQLLAFEQYPAAATCFEQVASAFPDSAEAWANLGYARLMMYCDAMKTDDLRKLGITQMAVGGFYTRIPSLYVPRGPDAKLWASAVEALEKALKLDASLALVKANLGVAYMVSPRGKDLDQSAKYIEEAAKQISGDAKFDPTVRASVLINAGVINMASGEMNLAPQRFDEAQKLTEEMATHVLPAAAALSSAVYYNRAVMLGDSLRHENRQLAIKNLEEYFKTASPNSAWWPLAYERYAKLCAAEGQQATDEKALKSQALEVRRPITQVALSAGRTITLGDPMAEIAQKLKQPLVSIPIAGNLVRLVDLADGISVIGRMNGAYPSEDKVLGICLFGPKSPAIGIRGAELASPAREVRVGMARAEFEKIVGGRLDAGGPLFERGTQYYVLRRLYLSARVDGGRVSEIVVAQVP